MGGCLFGRVSEETEGVAIKTEQIFKFTNGFHDAVSYTGNPGGAGWAQSRGRTTHALGELPRAEIYARRGQKSTSRAARAAAGGDFPRFEGRALAASPVRRRGRLLELWGFPAASRGTLGGACRVCPGPRRL
jgi:hypothetical protein